MELFIEEWLYLKKRNMLVSNWCYMEIKLKYYLSVGDKMLVFFY